MSDNTLQEFLVELGFKIDGNTEKKFNQSIKNAALQANLLADAIEGTMRVVAEGVEQMARNFASLEYASQRTKSSVQGLKDFSYAFSQIGGSAEGAQAMVEKFAGILRSNTGYGSWLKSFGVPTEGVESVDQVIALIRKLHQQYPDGTNFGVGEGIASQFGIDKESYYQLSHNLNALTEFRKQSNQTAKDLGLNSDEAAKKWKEFLQDFQQTSLVFKTVVEKVFTELEPGIQRSLEEFTQWLKKNEPAIRDNIEYIAGAVSGAADDFTKLAKSLEPVLSGLDQLIKKLTGQSGLKVAIEAAFGVWTLSKLRALFGLGAAVGGSSVLGTAALWFGLADPSYPSELNTPAGQKKMQEAEKGAWYNRAFNAVKKWWNGDTAASDSSPYSGSAKLNNGGNSARDQNALESYQFWRSKGFSREQALGLVGNEQGESDFDPHVKGDYDSALGRYTAGGSMQWHQDRRDAILAGTGIDVYDPNTTHKQHLEAAWWEFNNTHKRALRAIKNADTSAEAARAAVNYYEMPLDRAGDSAKRAAFARNWASRISDVAAKTSGGGNFSLSHPAFDWARNANANLGAINSGAPLGVTPSVMNNARTITVSPTTHVTVNGATDPSATANAIGNRLDSVNANVLRDTKGAVR